MAEYWVDNSRENEEMTAMGTGTEQDPFNMVRSVEKIIVPGAAHTIHLEGTNKPYKGGLGGQDLKSWYFMHCTVVKHETATKKVTFTACRTVPINLMTGMSNMKTMTIEGKFRMGEYRFIKDGNHLLLTRPDKLGDNADDGFSYDEKTKVLTIDTDAVPVKEDDLKATEVSE